jgi:hypothetical protein
MARKARDYKAEERRRNELARSRGYSSRGQQRRRIESGKAPAIRPELIRKESTREAQRRYHRENSITVGYPSKYQRAQDWSDLHAKHWSATYRPEERPKGMTISQYTDAYLKAFVTGPERYYEARQTGSEALRYWFVDVAEYLSDEDYNDADRYGSADHQ